MPFLLAQISDTHLGGPASVVDPAEGLRRTVAALLALPDRPDALLVSGDLSDDGSAASYEAVQELLAPLALEPHVIAGNHDDRAQLRRAFELPGEGAEPIELAVELGPLRLVGIDTQRPGEDRGELDPERLARLDAALAAAPDRPTVLALHHPPLHTAMPTFDGICLLPPERAALAAVLERHPQVLRLVSGHVHRAIVGELAGRPVFVVPSTHRQSALDFSAEEFHLTDDPPAFAIHCWDEGELTSYLVPVPQP